MKALAFDPLERYDSVEELRADLSKYMGGFSPEDHSDLGRVSIPVVAERLSRHRTTLSARALHDNTSHATY